MCTSRLENSESVSLCSKVLEPDKRKVRARRTTTLPINRPIVTPVDNVRRSVVRIIGMSLTSVT